MEKGLTPEEMKIHKSIFYQVYEKPKQTKK